MSPVLQTTDILARAQISLKYQISRDIHIEQIHPNTQISKTHIWILRLTLPLAAAALAAAATTATALALALAAALAAATISSFSLAATALAAPRVQIEGQR